MIYIYTYPPAPTNKINGTMGSHFFQFSELKIFCNYYFSPLILFILDSCRISVLVPSFVFCLDFPRNIQCFFLSLDLFDIFHFISFNIQHICLVHVYITKECTNKHKIFFILAIWSIWFEFFFRLFLSFFFSSSFFSLSLQKISDFF